VALTPALQSAEDVILRDGTTLRLRPPGAADASAVVDFFAALSERSRYQRFHGVAALRPELAEPFLEPDWTDRGSLVGELEGRIVALASYARLREPRTAEAAFAVADELQGKGVGTRLLERLAARAAAAGIERFVAEVMPDNRAMLRVFEDAGFEIVRELTGGEVEVRFSIAPTERFEEAVAERDHLAVVASLRPFFEPATVAVVGASPRRGSIGGELFRNVLAADFAGAAYPVNRGGEAVGGVRAYARVSEIPDHVDLAVVCLPGEAVLAAAEDALASGVRAVCVISAGFAESGAEGVDRQERLLALVRAHGARLVGPNCLGIAAAKPRLNATVGRLQLPPGNVGFSSQSGGGGRGRVARWVGGRRGACAVSC
jgi:RimJ/RimL family protein N-acetyltransferase/predicted CoA-binding protein